MRQSSSNKIESTDRVFLFSPSGGEGRDAVAVGLLNSLSKLYPLVSFFQPLFKPKGLLPLLSASMEELDLEAGKEEEHAGVEEEEYYANEPLMRRVIVTKFYTSPAIKKANFALVVGSDYSKVAHPNRMNTDASLSADLQCPVLLSVSGEGRSAEEISESIKACARTVQEKGSKILGAFVSPCHEGIEEKVRLDLVDLSIPIWFIERVEAKGDLRQKAMACFEAYLRGVNEEELFQALSRPLTAPVTPASFQYSLIRRASERKKTIVLPEGSEERVLRAANYVLSLDAVNIILLGEEKYIRRRAENISLSFISKAKILSMDEGSLKAKLEEEMKKALPACSEEEIADLIKDPSYFGTMLVKTGMADGMVSGAVHSTAQTVRPALRIIRTRPGSGIVSGSMLMCMQDHVDIYADVAIVPNPTPSQLSIIASQTCKTAKMVGIDPIVGFLSYSTLGSGKGKDVDMVKEAVEDFSSLHPKAPFVGPIQFDAAFSPQVAKLKAPNNPFAGRVSAYICPDLDSGNILYKAVERTGGAIAIGPVLQGLNKPVNDLSRGSTMWDIVNTIAITALSCEEEDDE
ncbi:MAG: phosphate acetyltransferase [Bifidobacteriaceae bacterium]|nr:phosphate acetyltransferase [Bifidobacteriaceae bacterium]